MVHKIWIHCYRVNKNMKKWKLLAVTCNECYLLDGENVFDARVSDKTCMVKDPFYKKNNERMCIITKANLIVI